METFNTLQSDSSTHITSIPPDAGALSALTESEDDLIQLDRGDRDHDHGVGYHADHAGYNARHHRRADDRHLEFNTSGGLSAGNHSGSSHGRRSPYR